MASLFAPVTAVWFAVIGVMGFVHIFDDLEIFHAFNPLYGVRMLVDQPGLALLVFGGVFLAVTGGEALYADMGHFGKKPIRLAWLCVVFPGLILNYLGQGAFIIAHPQAVENPFFLMAPGWGLIPLVHPRNRGHGDRLAGGDHRRLLDRPAGHVAGALARA